jgi:hypothetical protein
MCETELPHPTCLERRLKPDKINSLVFQLPTKNDAFASVHATLRTYTKLGEKCIKKTSDIVIDREGFTMTKNRKFNVFVLVLCFFVLIALACDFPELLTVDAAFPSAGNPDGTATLVGEVGCDCDPDNDVPDNILTGWIDYVDKDDKGKIKPKIYGEINFPADEDGCFVEDGRPLTGNYTPKQKKDLSDKGGTFTILYSAPNTQKCLDLGCGSRECWGLVLTGGKYDGYENWTCPLSQDEYTLVLNDCQ